MNCSTLHGRGPSKPRHDVPSRRAGNPTAGQPTRHGRENLAGRSTRRTARAVGGRGRVTEAAGRRRPSRAPGRRLQPQRRGTGGRRFPAGVRQEPDEDHGGSPHSPPGVASPPRRPGAAAVEGGEATASRRSARWMRSTPRAIIAKTKTGVWKVSVVLTSPSGGERVRARATARLRPRTRLPGPVDARRNRRPHALLRSPRPPPRTGPSPLRSDPAWPAPSDRSRSTCPAGRSRRPSARRPRRGPSEAGPPAGSSGPCGTSSSSSWCGSCSARNQPTFTTCPATGTLRGSGRPVRGIHRDPGDPAPQRIQCGCQGGSSAPRSRERGHHAPSSRAGAAPAGASDRRRGSAGGGGTGFGCQQGETGAVMTRTLPRADRDRPGIVDRRKRHGHGSRCAEYPRCFSVLLGRGVRPVPPAHDLPRALRPREVRSGRPSSPRH